MDIQPINIVSSDFYYHLMVRPADIVAYILDKQLYICDRLELLPTESPALQLVCLAKEQKIAVQLIPNNWRNLFKVEISSLLAFLEMVLQVYPHLANYLSFVCKDLIIAVHNSTFYLGILDFNLANLDYTSSF